MGDLWSEYWWAITLFLLIVAGGGISFTRKKK